jgi:tetratricopeptide (TPR) repeat protein
MKKGDKDQAISEYICAAEGYSKEELYQLAMSIYKTVLSIDLTLVPVYITLAELYERQGFIGDAAVTYERLAQYYLKEGKSQEVKDVVDKMTNLDPENQFIQKRAQRFLNTVSETAGDQVTLEEGLLTIESQGGEGFQAAVPENPIEDKGFFDLGAHLDDGQDFIPSDNAMKGRDASSMEVDAVFEGIQKNIEESSEEESYRLHYEIGIAYQQMDRFDEAIRELKMALGEADVKNDCFIRLCTCFREKEMYKLAVNAAKSGLKSRFISQTEYLGLHYELGLTYAEMGEQKKGLGSFVEIAKVDANYKDTRQIIEEMKGQI